jgi:hypothetical protein
MTAAKHASSKHARKERRTAERTMARDGADRLAEAARKREASEAAQRKEPCPHAPRPTIGRPRARRFASH